MMRRLVLVVGFVGILLAVGEDGYGQGFQGGVRGAIRDSGGAVPGAAVSLTNEDTGLSRSALTNTLGEYAFASVEAGTYKIKIALQGYKTIERSGVRVGTQSFLVLDQSLEVGAIEESVTVSVQTPVVETANASHGAVLDRVTLETLPSSGRAAFLMAASLPTVVPSGDGQFNRQQDQSGASSLSLGGGTRRGNNYVLDGVSITDIVNRAVANPTMEALEDVKVQVHTYDAEMGRTGGGVFNSTLKSGTNQFRGTAFFQTRPLWGQENNYFSQLAGRAKPDSVYYLGGGGVGGPIVKNKTFFWFATENYHDIQSRSVSTAFPTAAERTGDFSRLTNASGQPVVIYDPLTKQPFPGNIIPANRINAVAASIAGYFPLPDVDVDNGTNNYTRTAEINNKFQQEYTIKVEHKFTDAVSLSGFYLYNRTDEPDANYFEVGLNGATRFADPNDYLLKRRPQILAINNNWVVGNSSVLSLRFGLTRFPDNSTMTIDFDPSTLGFSPFFLGLVDQTGVPKFPNGSISGYSSFGAITPSFRTYKSWSTNASYSMLVGRHTFKFGGDFRQIGVDFLSTGDSTGRFQFDKEFTSATGLNNSSLVDGNGFASFLLGYPSANSARQSTMTLTTPLEIAAKYFGGYVQDDWRVSSKFTLNYGLRIEHETGMSEANNNFTVGFDPLATNTLSAVTIPADPIAGTPARSIAGGLMFAGIDGNPTSQGNPPGVQWSPRVGAVYSITPSLILRGGYGIYWAPWNYPAPSSASNNYGQVGFTNNTVVPQTAGSPSVNLTNPFPNGLVRAARQLDWDVDRRRHVDQLRRPEPHHPARAAVLARPAEGTAGPHGDHGQLYRRARRSPAARRHERYRAQRQSARSEVHGARSAAERHASESVLRQCRRRPAVDAGDADPGATAAPVSTVPQRQRPAGIRGHEPLQRRRHRVVAPDWRIELVWRPCQLYLQRPQGQPVRREQLLYELRSGPAAERLQLHRGFALLQPARRVRLRDSRPAASLRDVADCRGAIR